MTTIAFDGRTLCADRQITEGTRTYPACKVRRLADGRLVGIAGNASYFADIFKHLNEPDADADDLDLDDAEDITILVAHPDGRLTVLDDKLRSLEIQRPFHAIGSGQDYAIAAMALGQSAAQAVALASQFDAFTGLGLDTLVIDDLECEDDDLSDADISIGGSD